MAKEIYSIKKGFEGKGVYAFSELYILSGDLSQSKLKKLFKLGVKGVEAKVIEAKGSEEEAKKSESKED